MSDLTVKLASIQEMLNVPKARKNNFGNYYYRNLEDILDAVKPMMNGLTLTLSDSVKEFGSIESQVKTSEKETITKGMIVIEAIATISDGVNSVSVSAYAGVEKTKGMQLPQAFGAASSYARKYALNGLFMIDDAQDADAINTHGKEDKKEFLAPSADTTYEGLMQAGWDGNFYKGKWQGKDYAYASTEKANIFLSPKQAKAFAAKKQAA